MRSMVGFAEGLLEKGLLPDSVIRFGMRRLLAETLALERKDGLEQRQERLMRLIQTMRSAPIAVATREANEQHYELPTEFFRFCLGRHLKYSSCFYITGNESLTEAESIMLDKTAQRAELSDGQDILEFGCGWGSLSLFMAARFPRSRITAVSNSRTQKLYIDSQAKERGINNLEVITCDMNVFATDRHFDRIVSVEMFEHMRNWGALLAKAASFLKPQGKLFIHIFTHKEFAYFYDHKDSSDFIGRYFFTGGIMPSDDLLLYFQDHVRIEDHWQVAGTHYSKTARAWLENMDSHKKEIMPILLATYGQKEYIKWWHYWRIFYMACEELWGYSGGSEWMVSHYRFVKR